MELSGTTAGPVEKAVTRQILLQSHASLGMSFSAPVSLEL